MPDFTCALIRTCLLALIAMLISCATTSNAPVPSSVLSGPFFQLDATDAKAFRTLAREQDLQLATCSQEHSCEQAHFSRALSALFDNQRTAVKHFQEVIAGAPKSRLATVSADWLKLLHESPSEREQQGHLAKATQHAILELLNREKVVTEELIAHQKRVEELSTQLQTLKLIDQEMNEKVHRIRPRGRSLQTISEPDEAMK
jgi:hypothetical protein